MPEPLTMSFGRWARFDRYVVDGGYIRPAPDARFERFDPWARYEETRRRSGARVPPYGDLLSLVQELDPVPRSGPGPLQTLSPEQSERVVEWCCNNGLLGVLPQRAQMVTLAPRWGRLPDHDLALAPWQEELFRTNRGWVRVGKWGRRAQGTSGGGHREREGPGVKVGQVVSPPQIPRRWPASSVLLQDLHTGAWDREPLSRTWARFFPALSRLDAEVHPYPLPGTEDFWRLYGEPVREFIAAAELLRRAVDALGPGQSSGGRRNHEVRAAMDPLNLLLGPISPAAVWSDRRPLHQEWHAPSLLSHFALMAFLDLTEQRAPRTCATCGMLFVTTAYQGTYCSDKCRRTTQKRRYRARKKGMDAAVT